MRRKLFALIALLAVALPASAFAGHRSHHNSADARGSHCERPVRSGYVTVDNPNRVTMQVIIDGRNMGSVRAGDTARFGPLDEGQHKVAAKYVCNKRSLTRRIHKERVWVDARRPVRINLPYADLAIVEVSNEWIEGMDISVDGRTVDYVQANGRTAFIAPTYASVSLIEPAGTRAMTARIDGHGFSTESLTLIPPRHAKVLVRNPTRARLQLVDGNGRVLCDLAPNSSEQIRLRSGWTGLAVLFRGRTIDSTKLIASPFCNMNWNIEPQVALYEDYDDGRGRHASTHHETHQRRGYRRSSSRRVSWSSRWSSNW